MNKCYLDRALDLICPHSIWKIVKKNSDVVRLGSGVHFVFSGQHLSNQKPQNVTNNHRLFNI